METLYVIGKKDGVLGHPVRLSAAADAKAGEHLWGKVEIDSTDRLLSWFSGKFGSKAVGDRTFDTSPQIVLAWMSHVLEGGDLADCEFTVTSYDYPIEGGTTTLSRSFRRG